MTVRITVTTPDALLRDFEREAGRYPALVEKAFRRVLQRIGKRTRDILAREPGKVKYPIQWQSERQRRAFFATNGFGRGIGAPRTGAYSAGWKSTVTSIDKGGKLEVYNNVSYADFVGGFRQQRFHKNTGWEYAPVVLAKAQEQAEEALTTTFITLSDEFAGVR